MDTREKLGFQQLHQHTKHCETNKIVWTSLGFTPGVPFPPNVISTDLPEVNCTHMGMSLCNSNRGLRGVFGGAGDTTGTYGETECLLQLSLSIVIVLKWESHV